MGWRALSGVWGLVLVLSGCTFDAATLESRGCEADSDCASVGAGLICEAEVCVAGCTGPADCDSGACDPDTLRCLAANCQDLAQNGDETDVDCGGSCEPCEPGLSCASDGDCESQRCVEGACAEPTCEDGILNGSERDTDCGGGTCDTCVAGAACVVDADCESLLCVDGVCTASTCDDDVRNGGESDVDCGQACEVDCPEGVEGRCFKLCPTGDRCEDGEDCLTGVCDGGFCASPGCEDGRTNGFEIDLDCGGPICEACDVGLLCNDATGCATGSCRKTCADDPGVACDDDGDCATGACVEPRFCQEASCEDGVVNGTETDEDCGGSCESCPDGAGCLVNADCSSGVCDVAAERCVQAGCQDNTLNGDETDLDCGGPDCAPCAADLNCDTGDDCESRICEESGVCAEASCGDALTNGGETDRDCGGPTACTRCLEDERCELGSDCASGVCDRVLGTCRAPDCNDGVQNGAETGEDCGGPACGPCGVGEGCDDGADCESLLCDSASSTCSYFAPDCTVLFDLGVTTSAVYTIDPDGESGEAPFGAYCIMDQRGGGWTLAVKADGRLSTFRYDKAIWTNRDLLNPSFNNLARNEAKLQSFNSVPVEEVWVSFVTPPDGSGETRGVTIPVSAASLHALFNGGYVESNVGRSGWLDLIPGSDIQDNCNREGFNVKTTDDGGDSRARIGILGNNENHCRSPDSRIGIGTEGDNGASSNIAVGNSAGWNGWGNGRNIESFAYILIRSSRR